MRLLTGIMLLFLIVVLTIPTTITAGTRLDSVPDSKYLEYGAKHQCVLPIQGIMSDDLNATFRGSCVLIDPYHIITAAHVVSDSLTQNVVINNKVIPVSVIAVHSDFVFKKNGYNDIAVGRLSQPIEIDFYPKLYTGSDERGKVCSIAGWGHYGTLGKGYGPFDNKRRAGSNVVTSYYLDTLMVKTDDEHTSLEFLICPGDSGGGMFIDQKLAGINSFIMAKDGKGDADYGDEGCFTRISKFEPWIRAVIKQVDAIDKMSPEEIKLLQEATRKTMKNEKT